MENTQTFEQHLVQAGLSGEQARLYESLVKNGPSLASDAARRAAISRTLAYKVFSELAVLGLVEKTESPGKVALFTAAHPLKLKELIEKRQQAAKDALTALEGVIGQMTSEYNVAGGKPGIEFFEGMAGISKVLDDTLTAKEVIYTYADLKAIDDVYRDLNADYLEKRKRRGIEKKGILADTPFTRKTLEGYDTDVTDSRLVQYAKEPSKTIIQMYDGKTSYIVMDRAEPVSIIVHDPFITAANRSIFEIVWEHATPFTAKQSPAQTV
jgi:HTH-type transcriptional regulator, sugar sensing transcriptional regulator